MSSIFAQLLEVRGAAPAQLLELVQAHVAAGPWAPTAEGAPAHRELWVSAEVDGLVQIWESPGWLRPPPSALQRRLEAALPQARVEVAQRALGRPPSWSPQAQLRLTLQPHRQRAAMERLLRSLPERLIALLAWLER